MTSLWSGWILALCLVFSLCGWLCGRLPSAQGSEAFPTASQAADLGEQLKSESPSLPSLPILERLTAIVHFLKVSFANNVLQRAGSPHSSLTHFPDICGSTPTPQFPDGIQECPWPAGTGRPVALAEDKSEARGPVQILTVGQSDHAQDAGETAAGGGTRPSGQDLRATMQRKGEPCGGPVTPPKLSPRFSDAPFLRSMVSGGHEKLGQGPR